MKRAGRWFWPSLVLLALAAMGDDAAGRGADALRPPPRIRRASNWVHKAYDGMAYDTTSHAEDLDREVASGARILKYLDGSYVHAVHRQYPSACGPASLAMVLKQLGVADTQLRGLQRPVDVDLSADEHRTAVGYRGSPEDILWFGLRRRRLEPSSATWNGGHATTDADHFLSPTGLLDLRGSGVPKTRLSQGADMAYVPFSNIPRWLWKHPGVNYESETATGRRLPGIMNYIYSGPRGAPWRDAVPLNFQGRSAAEVVAYRRIVKGFVDHGISVVLGVDNTGHFNTLIGYRGDVEPATAPFYVYSADPLDGWGRPADRQPLRWRRTNLVAENLRSGSGALVGIICWNHHGDGGARTGFRASSWAFLVDRQNGRGRDWLTAAARQPAARDPLGDSLALPAERMPGPPPPPTVVRRP